MTIDTPADLAAKAKARASAPTRGRRGRTAVLVAAALVLTLLLASGADVAAAYFVPGYAKAVADTPLGVLTEPLLHANGQTPAQITASGQTVTSSGHTIRLIGAYADELQTTIYLQVDDQPLAAPASPTGKVVGDRYTANVELRDQFGRTYQERGGSGTSSLDFEPLTSSAARTGIGLTLHISRLYDMTTLTANGQGGPAYVDGDWTFQFTLKQRRALVLPLPAPLTVGKLTYTFTSIKAADTFAVKITVSGGDIQRLDQIAPASGPSVNDLSAYQVDLYNQAGEPQRISYGSLDRSHINASWVLDGTGRYRLHVGGPQGTDYWFDVPTS